MSTTLSPAMETEEPQPNAVLIGKDRAGKGWPTEKIEQALLEIIRDGMLETTEDFDVQSDLFNAGLDSMAIMQLLIFIEQRFSVALPAQEVNKANFHSVRSLARLIGERSSPASHCG